MCVEGISVHVEGNIGEVGGLRYIAVAMSTNIFGTLPGTGRGERLP
jgi:hypothetical protein